MSLTVLEDFTSSTEEGRAERESSGYKDNDGTFGSKDISEAACPRGLAQMSPPPAPPSCCPTRDRREGGGDPEPHGAESHSRP